MAHRQTARACTLVAIHVFLVTQLGIEASAAPDRLVITGPTTINIGECSPFTVHAQDAAQTDAPVDVDTKVELLCCPPGNFSQMCAGDVIDDIVIPAGQATQGFRYRQLVTVGSPVTLVAADLAGQGDDLSAADGTLIVSIFGPDRLAISGPTDIGVAACVPYTVRAQDSAENDTPVFENTTVDLSGGLGGSFHLADDFECSGVTDQVVILAREAIQTFRYTKGDLGPVTLIATDRVAQGEDLSAANGSVVVSVAGFGSGPPPDRLSISGPTTIAVGECGRFTVYAQSADQIDAPVGVNTTVDLSDGGAFGIFELDFNCDSGGGFPEEVEILQGYSTATFNYLKKDRSGSPITLVATDRAAQGEDLSAVNGSIVVSVSGPDRLALFGPTVIDTGECAHYTVHAQDAAQTDAPLAVPTRVDLSVSGADGAFFADVACETSAITEVTIAPGEVIEGFRYRKNSAGTVRLVATDRPGQGEDLSASDGSLFVNVPGEPLPTTSVWGFSALLALLVAAAVWELRRSELRRLASRP